MNGVIIYKGKYGATQQYAHWLAEETGLYVLPASAIGEKQLNRYDFLVIGSSVYIGQLQIKKWLKKNLEYIRDKKIFFFQVAGTPPEEKEKRQVYNNAGIPKEIMEHCDFYFFPGKMIIRQLSWIDRFMLKIGARMAKDPADQKAMLTEYNNVNKEWISEVVKAVKKLSRKNEPAACILSAQPV